MKNEIDEGMAGSLSHQRIVMDILENCNEDTTTDEQNAELKQWVKARIAMGIVSENGLVVIPSTCTLVDEIKKRFRALFYESVNEYVIELAMCSNETAQNPDPKNTPSNEKSI